jgi:hypothetical protein
MKNKMEKNKMEKEIIDTINQKYYCKLCHKQFNAKSYWKHISRKCSCLSREKGLELYESKEQNQYVYNELLYSSKRKYEELQSEIDFFQNREVNVFKLQKRIDQLEELIDIKKTREDTICFLRFINKTDNTLLSSFMEMFKDVPVTAGNAKEFLSKFPTESRSVPMKTKKETAYDQEYKCNGCKVLMSASYEVDHIIPLYLGGANNKFNLQALCRNCHGDKTAKDETGFYYNLVELRKLLI